MPKQISTYRSGPFTILNEVIAPIPPVKNMTIAKIPCQGTTLPGHTPTPVIPVPNIIRGMVAISFFAVICRIKPAAATMIPVTIIVKLNIAAEVGGVTVLSGKAAASSLI